MNKKILVTGGAGLIGSHLCHRLIQEGHEVTCLDNMLTGQIENIQHLIEHPNFTFIYGDINELPEVGSPEQIYNLASPASPADYESSPIETVKINVLGTMNILELALKNKARVLEASAGEVYGNPQEHPQKETYPGSVNPTGISSSYDEAKRCAESLCFDYHRKFGVEIKIARIFNTYGPNMRLHDGRVVSNFIVSALTHSPLKIYGKSSHKRSFCYVEDMVDGLIKLMNSAPEFTGPVNLGYPEEISINALADKVVNLTQSMSRIEHEEIKTDDPESLCPDITLAKEVLNWSPRTGLDEGLAKTTAYFQSSL